MHLSVVKCGLSNFVEEPFYYQPRVGNEIFLVRTVEAAFQGEKALHYEEARRIYTSVDGREAKRLGRLCKMSPSWNYDRDEVMDRILQAKARECPLFRKRLLDTGLNILVEYNTWHDNYWGSCTCDRCGSTGKNNLGKTLMRLRDDLRGGRWSQD